MRQQNYEGYNSSSSHRTTQYVIILLQFLVINISPKTFFLSKKFVLLPIKDALRGSEMVFHYHANDVFQSSRYAYVFRMIKHGFDLIEDA